MNRFLRLAAVCVPLLGAGATSNAQDIPGYPSSILAFDPREVALLPRYCKYTYYFKDKVPGGADVEARKRWFGVFGPIFEGMQHYCFGLMKTNRAILLARDGKTRRFYLEDAISEYDFVLDRAPADFILLPEILTKKGENLFRLDRAPVAVFVLERAIAAKPDYWPPYAALSDHAKQTGDREAARRWLEKGLAAAPDTPALTRRLHDLGANHGSKSTADSRND